MKAIVFLIFIAGCHHIYSSPITTIAPLETTVAENDKVENRSVSDMVIQQTETVKQIVAEQQQQDYPVITKMDLKDNVKKDLDRLSLDELKIRCQHLQKLLNNSRLHQESNTNKPPIQYQVGYKPLFVDQRKRPVYIPPTTNKIATVKPGFYVTTHPAATSPRPMPMVTTTNTTVSTNVKYIRLEPVILQKTFLTDGRTVYYWHKSLPSAVGFQQQLPTMKPSTEQSVDEDINETTETQTSSPYYNRYDIRNFFNFYRTTSTERPTTSITTTTTTTTTTTPKPHKVETMFENQLRFVVPVPYQNPEGVSTKNVWGFDQFAYYPKDLQPSAINVQVPYTPTFHVIKALAVPNKYATVNTPALAEEGLDNVATK